MNGALAKRLDKLSRPDQAFEASLFLSIAAGQTAVILTGQLHPLHVAAMTLALFGGALQRNRLEKVPQFAWNALILLVLFGSLATAILSPPDFETYFRAISYFLVYVLLIRYFTRKTDRDSLVLLLLALLEVCAASIMTISISFMVSIVIFVGFMCSSLMLLVLRMELNGLSQRRNENPQPVSIRGPRFSIPLRFFGFSFASALAIFLTGLLIFFVIPRVGRSLFAWRTGIHTRAPGFSSTVELGSVGSILRGNNSLVLRADIEGADSDDGPFYFRGSALDYYDGKSWTDTASYKMTHFYRYEGTVTLKQVKSLGDLAKQEIVLEPIDSHVLFALPQVKTIQAPFKYRAVVEYWNDYIGFPLASPIYDRVVYTAWSKPSPRTMLECRQAYQAPAASAPDWYDNYYLQLPEGSERLSELAREIAGDQANDCAKIFRVRDYLIENYTYDLNTESDFAQDPLGHFLFESRSGYCEHFASATALLLRSLGIRTRVAAGFYGGHYNPVGEYFVVRGRSAHTWVEVYMPNGEWLLVDATPPQAEAASIWPIIDILNDYLDSVRYMWDLWVVNLSLADQFRLATAVRHSTQTAGREAGRLPARIMALVRVVPGGTLTVVVLFLAGAAYFLLIKKKFSLKSAGPDDASALVRRYLRLLDSVRKNGYARRPSETPLELAARIEGSGAWFAPEFKNATGRYLEVRFGEGLEVDEALAAISRAIERARERPG